MYLYRLMPIFYFRCLFYLKPPQFVTFLQTKKSYGKLNGNTFWTDTALYVTIFCIFVACHCFIHLYHSSSSYSKYNKKYAASFCFFLSKLLTMLQVILLFIHNILLASSRHFFIMLFEHGKTTIWGEDKPLIRLTTNLQ